MKPSAGLFGGVLPILYISKLIHVKVCRRVLIWARRRLLGKLESPSLGRGGACFLVVPFQAAGWDDPEELFGGQGFRFSVDRESQMAVFFADAERKDLLQVQEAAGDIPTLCRQLV